MYNSQVSFILSLYLFLSLSTAATTKTLIPSTVFDSYKTFESYFNYNYPWGDTHNAAAKMVGNSTYHEYIYLSDSTLVLKSVPAKISADLSYYSGTCYAKQKFALPKGGMLTFDADYLAPVVEGTWPALWLNAASGWPPEVDMAEWKGSSDIWFNTFNASNNYATTVSKPYPNDNAFHNQKTTITDEDGKNAVLNFYLDGVLQTTEYAANYVGTQFELIIDLQMLGSSGNTGPTGNTTFKIKGLTVTETTS